MGTTFVLLLLLAWQRPTPQQGAQNQIETNSQSNQRPTGNGTPVAQRTSADQNASPTKDQTEHARQESVKIVSAPEIFTESKKDSWDKALVISTCTLVLVGLAQIIFLWNTVRATRDNAQSARGQVEAVVASERAWLVPATEFVKPNDLPPGNRGLDQVETVTVRFENCGRTLAWLMDWFVEVVVLDRADIGPITNTGQPVGEFPATRPVPQRRIKGFPCEWTTSSLEIKEIESGKKQLYVRGFIHYRSLGGKEPRVSYFCFHYFRERTNFGDFEEGWRIEPPEYNEYT